MERVLMETRRHDGMEKKETVDIGMHPDSSHGPYEVQMECQAGADALFQMKQRRH